MKNVQRSIVLLLCGLLVGCSTTEALIGGATLVGIATLEGMSQSNKRSNSSRATPTPAIVQARYVSSRPSPVIPKPTPTPKPTLSLAKVAFQRLQQGIDWYERGDYRQAISVLESIRLTDLHASYQSRLVVYLAVCYRLTNQEHRIQELIRTANQHSIRLHSDDLSDFPPNFQQWLLRQFKTNQGVKS